MDNRMTVVFIGFDGYSDMWDDCMGLYRRFWPDCPYKTVFVNNQKDVSYDGAEVLHAGADAEWSRKVQAALEAVDTPYVCLLLEDFLVGAAVDSDTVSQTLDLIEAHKVRYFKLTNMNRAAKNRDPHFAGKPYLHVIPQSDEYGVSLQPAIWRADYLAELVGEGNYNAWQFEFDRVHEAAGKPDEPNEGCVFDERNILQLQHGVIQSKYLPGTVSYFKRLGINLNIERPIMSRAHYYRLRLQSKAKYMMPKGLRRKVKRLMEKLGYKFVSTERDRK
jgi:hypothetical protein